MLTEDPAGRLRLGVRECQLNYIVRQNSTVLRGTEGRSYPRCSGEEEIAEWVATVNVASVDSIFFESKRVPGHFSFRKAVITTGARRPPSDRYGKGQCPGRTGAGRSAAVLTLASGAESDITIRCVSELSARALILRSPAATSASTRSARSVRYIAAR